MEIPFLTVFTKLDKLKTFVARKKCRKNTKPNFSETWEELPDIYITAEKKIGGERNLKFVEKRIIIW